MQLHTLKLQHCATLAPLFAGNQALWGFLRHDSDQMEV